ncbi:MAG: bifunctional diguanylate cyclase/phosphodiesterase [Spirochaetia bacterium]
MNNWEYIDPIVKSFLHRSIQIGVIGLVVAVALQIADGATSELFIWINSGGLVVFSLLLFRPNSFSNLSKILLISVFFWILILTSFFYSGLLGTGEIMIALFIVLIVISLRPVPGIILTVLSVLTIFVFALLVHNRYLPFSPNIYFRHTRAAHWLVQGIVLAIFAALSVSIINYLRTGLLKTIEDLKNSNDQLLVLNRKLESRTNQISRLAYYDRLTDLPNRVYLKQHMDKRISSGVDRAALVLFDLRNFRTLNSLLGNTYGDKVLRAIGENLISLTDDRRFFARLGGDEFGLWVEEYNPERLSEDIAQLARQFAERIESEYNISQRISYSAAAARYPEDGHTYQECIKAAGAAMKIAKEQKTSKLLFFNEEIFATVQEISRMQRLLERAVEHSEFRVVYQPKVNMRNKQTVGVEALARWSTPNIGEVNPEVFIENLTKLNLIIPFSKTIIKQILSDIPRLQQKFSSNLLVSINISPVMFLEHDFVEYIMNELAEYKVEPSSIILEITEDIFIDDPEKIKQVFSELHSHGIGVSLDDFGKGYSSLSYMRSFEFTEIKVDRLFIENICSDKRSYSLFQSICSIAAAYDYKVVAEGVEQKAQIQTILEAGCDIAQGYYFSEPKALGK